MPELPEVETCLRGVAPLVSGRRVDHLVLRTGSLRWPLDPHLKQLVAGVPLLGVSRRAKYLLFRLQTGTLLLHLGMSGSLRVLPASTPPGKHDHVDLVLDDGQTLRLTDPRKFGALLWIEGEPAEHPLLARLGPEPLTENFSAKYLLSITRNRRQAIKPFIMDQKRVVGVGNIYASEALFRAGIRPGRAAGRISLARCRTLVEAIKEVLLQAIAEGGTTLQDFSRLDGRPGYFKQQLKVYGRAGESCVSCGGVLHLERLGQRATCFCPTCQK